MAGPAKPNQTQPSPTRLIPSGYEFLSCSRFVLPTCSCFGLVYNREFANKLNRVVDPKNWSITSFFSSFILPPFLKKQYIPLPLM